MKTGFLKRCITYFYKDAFTSHEKKVNGCNVWNAKHFFKIKQTYVWWYHTQKMITNLLTWLMLDVVRQFAFFTFLDYWRLAHKFYKIIFVLLQKKKSCHRALFRTISSVKMDVITCNFTTSLSYLFVNGTKCTTTTGGTLAVA